MSMMKNMVAAGIALAALAGAPAVAQNVNANPTYTTLNLTAGFPDDPRVVNLQSGGNINAQSINSGCTGYIADAPDVRLVYSAGSLPLIISVAAAADTTLVVNGPDGTWYCDDDSGNEGMNPMIRFSSPQSGRYEIWVGTYGGASLESAQLHVSELTSR